MDFTGEWPHKISTVTPQDLWLETASLIWLWTILYSSLQGSGQCKITAVSMLTSITMLNYS
jgi:hypothetical protein